MWTAASEYMRQSDLTQVRIAAEYESFKSYLLDAQRDIWQFQSNEIRYFIK